MISSGGGKGDLRAVEVLLGDQDVKRCAQAKLAFGMAALESDLGGLHLFLVGGDAFGEAVHLPPGLPEFDVIALHGVWSWVSETNRSVIVDLIRRRLAPGGVVYLSYNAQVGWAAAAPLRDLLALHADVAGSALQGPAGRIDAALDFAESLAAAGALHFQRNPVLADRLRSLRGQDRRYLAHEYLARDWRPQSFAQVADRLAEAKLAFGASAHLLDHVDAVNLTDEGMAFLTGISHPVLRETARDYLVNQAFRRDIFTKGARRLSPAAQAERLDATRFALIAPPGKDLHLNGPLGDITPRAATFGDIMTILAETVGAPRALGELRAHPLLAAETRATVDTTLILLAAAGYIAPVPEQPNSAARRERCLRLNAALCERARWSGDIQHLASPVIGGGVAVGRLDQLFLRARAAGHADAAALARATTADVLAPAGLQLMKDGAALTDPGDLLGELTAKAGEFLDLRLPLLKRLQVTA